MKTQFALPWQERFNCTITILFVLVSGTSQATPPRLKLEPVVENVFSSPVAITNAGDGSGRLFVVDQRGTVHIITADDSLLPEPFLDISDKLVPERPGFDERGLLSVAFHPRFGDQPTESPGSGKFYVYYSAPSPNAPGTDESPVDHMSVVSEFNVLSPNSNGADPASERVLLTFDQPQFNHDAGQLAFGPDGFLYISTGDGGGGGDNEPGHTGGGDSDPSGGLGNSQDLTNLLGKILRIAPGGTDGPGGLYGIPPGNPFTGGTANERAEIYAYGLRNPWRFSFDRGGDNRLFCADVGQGDVEEINLITSGGNYGWRRFEGEQDFDVTAPTTGSIFEAPVAQYAHPGSDIPGLPNIGISVTGGFVYRGSLIPDLVGTYVFGDWSTSFSDPSGTLLALEPDGGSFDLSILEIEGGNPRNLFLPAFGEDEAGEIYVAAKTTLAPSANDAITGLPTGSIFRLALAPPVAPLPKVRLEPVTGAAFFSPVAITNAGDKRLFVVDQRGTIHIIDGDGVLLPEPFLDISSQLVPERPGFDERGLLSVAFHPNFLNTMGSLTGVGKFYVYYSAPSPNAPGTDEDPVDHMTVIAEYEVTADRNIASPASERILLTFDQPQFNHDGGQLAFGPDGFLYISTGDGGGGGDNEPGHTGGGDSDPSGGLGNSQDLTNLLGKILRIAPAGPDMTGDQYSIPPSNPFAAADDGARDEIYAYGLRNPWRFSFDSGRLFCADVGQGDVEEINLITSGGNYGWRRFEGTFDFDATAPTTGNTFEAPVAQYAHPNTDLPGLPKVGISVTGGQVYRGTDSPGLDGAYLFGDWSDSFGTPNGTLLALTPGDSPDTFALGALDVEGGNPVGMFLPTFGRDADGEVYVAGKTTLAPSAGDPSSGAPTGGVFRIVEIGTVTGTPEVVTIEPVADATIFEEATPRANGGGRFLFSGHTNVANNGLERRALLEFDIAATVPAGSTIASATASLNMNNDPRAGDVPSSFGLHPVLADWGEGTDNAPGNEGQGVQATNGSVTWLSTAFNQGPDWSSPGGDFETAPSASVTIASVRQRYEWTSAQLAADVQGWLDDPTTNFGWMLFSDSDSDASARRFNSRETTTAASRPMLEITYMGSPEIPGYRETWLAQFYPNTPFPGDLSDDDGDTLNALFEYSAGSDPTSQDDPAGFFEPSVDPETGEISISFLRDPRATDLTYLVEFSTDLTDWLELATSSGGGGVNAATGSTIIERPNPDNFPVRSVDITLPSNVSGPSAFFRLSVTINDL